MGSPGFEQPRVTRKRCEKILLCEGFTARSSLHICTMELVLGITGPSCEADSLQAAPLGAVRIFSWWSICQIPAKESYLDGGPIASWRSK